MSLAMILIQQNDASSSKVASVREKYTTILADKHEDAMAKFGAAVSQGIIDAGGRNVTISMQNKSGSGNMPALVGMALFQQFWYWFPLAHCLSLAFTPTAIIGVNKDLAVGRPSFLSQAYGLGRLTTAHIARTDPEIRLCLQRETVAARVPSCDATSDEGDCRKGQDGCPLDDRQGNSETEGKGGRAERGRRYDGNREAAIIFPCLRD